jgi:hypothetical protein
MSKTYKSQSKLIEPKEASTSHISLLQVTGSDPIPHGLLHELEQLIFGRFVIRLHVHHLKCMHSF